MKNPKLVTNIIIKSSVFQKIYELQDMEPDTQRISRPKKHIPAPIPDECSIHAPVATSSVVPNKFNELRMLHNFRRARKAADSYVGSPVNRDNAPISRIREPNSTHGKLTNFR